ncbi:hypothetical protein OS493_032563 [Desmophyllum pertusum]|uniref:Homeobox domain-containing protein n=1 Tax=Desmophyllum pertusum TaxID=174260 RepID=A0A9W9YVV1_9CNID|nr:hypothetical protein OS493_032563 [Desmophyllum pertusum]
MDLKQLERYNLHGYVFVPCCTEDYCQNQLQGFQAIPSSSYSTSVPNCDAILPKQRDSTNQATHAPLFTSHRESDCRLLFPAIQRQRLQPCEVSRSKIGVPATSVLREFHGQRGWKMGAGCKPKRNRTIFTADQLERLEKEFDHQQYIVGSQRSYLATDLGLNETQVKVWFQNRRIKWRRQNLNSMGSTKRSTIESDDENSSL